MQRFIDRIGLLLLFAHLQLISGVAIEWVYGIGVKHIKPIISKSFKPEWYQYGISLAWWVSYNSDCLLNILTYVVLALVAKKYSYRLYLMSLVFVGYHCFDGFMLWYDYRQSHWAYFVEMTFDVIALLVLKFVKERNQAVVKSLI